MLRPTALLLATLLAAPSGAAICDYRLGEMISARAPALAGAAADQALLAVLGGRGPDFFTLVDPGSGFAAFGGFVGPARSAAALATAEALGGGNLALTNPVAGMAAGAAVLGMVGLEGVCRFQDERITDYYEVLAVLSAVADTADRDAFQLQLGPPRKKGAVVEIWEPGSGVRRQYRVADLIFVNGELRLRRWGPNKSLGLLMQFQGATPVLTPR